MNNKTILNSAFVSTEEDPDNTLLDLHNSSDDTKAEFNNC